MYKELLSVTKHTLKTNENHENAFLCPNNENNYSIELSRLKQTKIRRLLSVGPQNNISHREASLTAVGDCAPSWLTYVEYSPQPP
jgi:hypothetical protein